MRFQTISQVVILMTASLASGIHVSGSLRDGFWKGTQLPNGTTITVSLSDPSISPIIEHHEVIPRRSVEERGSGGDCWGYYLDASDVDSSNAQLQNQFRNGYTACSPSDSNQWWGWVTNGALVYFCDDDPSECFYINPGIIQSGMGLMDAICPAYQASWALFPNTGSARFIMGKCAINSNICV